MPIGKSTEESTRTGVYHVKESGLEYQHLRNETIPKDGKEYLDRFRYVDTNAMKHSVLQLECGNMTTKRRPRWCPFCESCSIYSNPNSFVEFFFLGFFGLLCSACLNFFCDFDRFPSITLPLNVVSNRITENDSESMFSKIREMIWSSK